MNKIIQNTALCNAFLNIQVKPKHHLTHGHLLVNAGSALRNHVGEVKVPSWNAHLRHRTYQKLRDEGVMA